MIWSILENKDKDPFDIHTEVTFEGCITKRDGLNI